MRKRLIDIGAPPERTRVQPLIADVGAPPPSPATGRPIVMMAGRFVEKKGFVDGVRAFAAAAADHPDATLLVVGDGPEKSTILQAIADSDAYERITWRPFLDRAEYQSAVERASIMLQPSRTASDGDTEGGAPTTLFDAQARGTVIVASDHADIPFVVDPRAAYLSVEGDADALTENLRHALSDRDTWTDRARLGYEHVAAQHSRPRVVELLEAAYDDARTSR